MGLIVAIVLVQVITPATSSAHHLSLMGNKVVCDDCVVPMIRQTKATNIHFIYDTHTDICITHTADRPSGMAWTSSNRPGKLVLVADWEDVCLISANDTLGLQMLLQNFHYCQRAKIILKYSKTSRDGVRNLFELCWKQGITDVVAVEERADICRVFSYFPFSENKCFDLSPVPIYSWEKRLSGTLNLTLFPDKLPNLNWCPLIVEYGTDTSEGPFHRKTDHLLPFLLKAMKATTKSIPRVLPVTNSYRGELLINTFYPYVERLHKFVFSPVTCASITGICFPVQRSLFVEWSRILNGFSRHVWCGVVMSASLITFYVYFIIHQTKIDSSIVVLNTLRTLMSHPLPRNQAMRWQDKICFPLWLYLCLVLNSAYQSELKSKLTRPLAGHAITSIEDFNMLDIPIHVSQASYKFATEIMLKEPSHKRIVEKMVVSKNITPNDLLRRHDGRAAYICENDNVYLLFNGSYQVLKDALVENLVSIFMLPKPSPYERLFRKAFLRIYDAGALDDVRATFNQLEVLMRRKFDHHNSLSFRALSGAFLVWFLGSCIAFIIFLGEIFVFR